MEKFSISFQYTKEEYIKAFRKYLFKSKVLRKLDFVAAGIMFVVEFYLLIQKRYSIYSLVIGMFLVFYILLFSVIYFIQPISTYNQNTKLHQTYHLTFSKDKIIFITNDVTSTLSWNIYKKFWETEEFYYLIQAQNIYTILPKRVFDSENKQQLLKEMITTAHIPYTDFTK